MRPSDLNTPAVIDGTKGTRLVLQVTNADAMRHDLVLATGQRTPLLAGGENATLTVGVVNAEIAGWCSVPGHRVAGMTLSIVVTGTGNAASSAAKAPGAGPEMGAMARQRRQVRSHQSSTSEPPRDRAGSRTT